MVLTSILLQNTVYQGRISGKTSKAWRSCCQLSLFTTILLHPFFILPIWWQFQSFTVFIPYSNRSALTLTLLSLILNWPCLIRTVFWETPWPNKSLLFGYYSAHHLGYRCFSKGIIFGSCRNWAYSNSSHCWKNYLTPTCESKLLKCFHGQFQSFRGSLASVSSRLR